MTSAAAPVTRDPAADSLRGARVVVLVNPASGRGRAEPLARAIESALRERGAAPEIVPVRESAGLGGGGAPRAVVLIGGDGTLHHSLGLLAGLGAPVRVAPCGTENLFARVFAMRPSVEDVLSALERNDVRTIDVARRDGAPFVVMMSVGPDAAIVDRVARERRGAITHMSYARPVLAQALRPTLPRLRVVVDGREVVRDRRGWLVVANARQYALRIDPACDAQPDDGLLDVVFMPARTGVAALVWALRARARRARGGSVVRARGREIDVEALGADAPVQMDGEAAAPIAPGRASRITIEPGALRVLA